MDCCKKSEQLWKDNTPKFINTEIINIYEMYRSQKEIVEQIKVINPKSMYTNGYTLYWIMKIVKFEEYEEFKDAVYTIPIAIGNKLKDYEMRLVE